MLTITISDNNLPIITMLILFSMFKFITSSIGILFIKWITVGVWYGILIMVMIK